MQGRGVTHMESEKLVCSPFTNTTLVTAVLRATYCASLAEIGSLATGSKDDVLDFLTCAGMKGSAAVPLIAPLHDGHCLSPQNCTVKHWTNCKRWTSSVGVGSSAHVS
ncbi:hypothetical protein TGPRC2_298070 [Toxoplasma gondii TgCatPRC2]|uniref:Uncharacterized protein n=1 Tax=Toxoplasma gondii TgCatPRC2 TaxID=1130821 RepID=A0A151H1T1_TOXGO|nr:hypothetical protein TGPRC2_298070 [Toxoplasma gondii TgCatPRC2]